MEEIIHVNNTVCSSVTDLNNKKKAKDRVAGGS